MMMSTGLLLPSVLASANKKITTNAGEVGPREDELGRLFSESVEQALTDLLGAKGREALLDYLERHDRLARGDLLGHPREFTVLLAKAFGQGCTTIERHIIRRFYATLSLEHEGTSEFDFGLQLEVARKCWERSHNAGS